jgi:hypothetical protein
LFEGVHADSLSPEILLEKVSSKGSKSKAGSERKENCSSSETEIFTRWSKAREEEGTRVSKAFACSSLL